MQKSERLNDMMLYLNDKNSFHLKDIMGKYAISKSTAIRDLKSLEQIGMPIYSQVGRNGYYGILSNRLLSPIVFTVDEMYALYFSMCTLRAYESTPFHLHVEKLKEKFEMCLSEEKVEAVHKMEKVLTLGVLKHHNSSVLLKEILQMAIEEKGCEILYKKESADTLYVVQFFEITSAYGQWYVTAHNFATNRPQVFRCDKIISMKQTLQYATKTIDELKKAGVKIFRNQAAIDFEVVITKKGVDLFHKEHYPSIQLYMEEEKFLLRGFYNQGEENFIANYLIAYAENIISIKPDKLKNLLCSRIDALKQYYTTI
ncbi:helix-turn-helix transcriptional regulator [Anaerosinus massiliensis]|uniref:helix-turn-helix transcriptional regulator n=1 Tax=Massilibacillus massiliensis TaxID=1806837 RepID=UPI000A95EE27|nr:WYL domain-containing protein [Massilibacillus massiliensis]